MGSGVLFWVFLSVTTLDHSRCGQENEQSKAWNTLEGYKADLHQLLNNREGKAWWSAKIIW